MADLVSAGAAEHAPAAYFASGADSLGALRVGEPDSCHIVARLLDDSLPRCLSSLAGRAIDDSTAGRFRAMLDSASFVLLESQCGPFASRVLTALPACHELSLDSPVFRAVLLRRLRLPLPLDAAASPSCTGTAALQSRKRP